MSIESHFTFVPAENPDIEDDIWELTSDPNWHVQICSGDDNGSAEIFIAAQLRDESLVTLGRFATLEPAMEKVVRSYALNTVNISSLNI